MNSCYFVLFIYVCSSVCVLIVILTFLVLLWWFLSVIRSVFVSAWRRISGWQVDTSFHVLAANYIVLNGMDDILCPVFASSHSKSSLRTTPNYA